MRRLRTLARDTWRTRNPRGLDVSAIEHMDRRSLEIVREDGVDRLAGVTWPDGTAIALVPPQGEYQPGRMTGIALASPDPRADHAEMHKVGEDNSGPVHLIVFEHQTSAGETHQVSIRCER